MKYLITICCLSLFFVLGCTTPNNTCKQYNCDKLCYDEQDITCNSCIYHNQPNCLSIKSISKKRWKNTGCWSLKYRWGGANNRILFIKSNEASWRKIKIYDGNKWRTTLIGPRSEGAEPIIDNTGTIKFRCIE